MRRQKISSRKISPRELPKECLCCGEGNPWVINTVDFVAPFRDAEYTVRAEVNQCRYCDAIATTEEQVAVISAKVREAHQKRQSVQLKAARNYLGMSLRELESCARIPLPTLARISSGNHVVEETIETLLWLQIDRLTRNHVMETALQIEQNPFRVTEGFISVDADLEKAEAYLKFLEPAPQSPLAKTIDSRTEGCKSDEFFHHAVFA